MNARIHTIAAALMLVALATSADAQGQGRGKPAAGVSQTSPVKAKGRGTDAEYRIHPRLLLRGIAEAKVIAARNREEPRAREAPAAWHCEDAGA
jgi:hypothetical protein